MEQEWKQRDAQELKEAWQQEYRRKEAANS